jgi:hypothetical protein
MLCTSSVIRCVIPWSVVITTERDSPLKMMHSAENLREEEEKEPSSSLLSSLTYFFLLST